jgi:hypothetical protein
MSDHGLDIDGVLHTYDLQETDGNGAGLILLLIGLGYGGLILIWLMLLM